MPESLEISKMELPTVKDSFAVSAEEAERITLILEKQFASRFTDHDKGDRRRDTYFIMPIPGKKSVKDIPGNFIRIKDS